MNIVFDHQIFSQQKYGGVSRYFYEIANRITALPGNNVEIFAPLYVNEYFRREYKVRPRGIKIPSLRGSLRIIDVVNRYVSRFLLKSRQDIDVFHETYYSMTDSCPVSAKRLITVYDMIHEQFPEGLPDASWIHQRKVSSVQRADHVICISENTKRDLVKLLAVPKEKISVIYLGCSLTVTTDKKTCNPAGVGKPHILYVGARSGYKNFERFLRAYASSLLLRKFTLVCFGWRDFLSSELKLMRSLNIPAGNVIYMSGTDEVLAGLYGSAAAFVYPSLYEGFGIPLLEAMSLGCPVVCANASSLPEVAGDAAELFDPYDETAMRDAIERVVSNPEYAASLVEKGRRRASLFSWEKCAKDTLDVYHKVLGS